MCSIVVSPKPDGNFLLGMNRDERRTRSPALELRSLGDGALRAAFPVDPDGGGTWIASRRDGLTLALMNQYDRVSSELDATPISRGTLIPKLLSAVDLTAAFARLPEILASLPGPVRPFWMIGIEPGKGPILSYRWRGVLASAEFEARTREDSIFSSSSWNPDESVAYRSESFRNLIAREVRPLSQERIRAFLTTVIPGHETTGVAMRRPESRTVSTTIVALMAEGYRLEYEPHVA
jgi:hypothetical protein